MSKLFVVLIFLKNNETVLMIIFSFLVAIATLVYAKLTWELVSETRHLRRAQTEPNISITIQPNEEMLERMDMIVQNHGFGSAYNLQFTVNPDFEMFSGMLLSEMGFIKNGLKYLAPNQKIQFILAVFDINRNMKNENSFEIKVTYQNVMKAEYEHLYCIDFSQFNYFSQLGEAPLQKIADKIDIIQKDIYRISSGSHKMKVIMYTKNEEEEEKKSKLEKMILDEDK